MSPSTGVDAAPQLSAYRRRAAAVMLCATVLAGGCSKDVTERSVPPAVEQTTDVSDLPEDTAVVLEAGTQVLVVRDDAPLCAARPAAVGTRGPAGNNRRPSPPGGVRPATTRAGATKAPTKTATPRTSRSTAYVPNCTTPTVEGVACQPGTIPDPEQPAQRGCMEVEMLRGPFVQAIGNLPIVVGTGYQVLTAVNATVD